MYISNPQDTAPICSEDEVYSRLLPLRGATVVELGCGTAVHTRAIAEKTAVHRVEAFEVDEIQHARNVASARPANLTFHAGGAQAIPLADQVADVVMMFKSLHHVPVPLMDQALREVARILRPGGLAYISEPVFAGDFNEILRMFHDEQAVREAAFAAVERAVNAGLFTLTTQSFFLAPNHFQDFAEFANRILNVTHTEFRLTAELDAAVKAKFESHMTAEGAKFLMPIRVDLLRKP
jgi:SAM-dependent methyltransferase